MKRLLIATIAIAALTSGCTTYKSPAGASYKNFMFKKAAHRIKMTDPDGSALEVEGLKSDADAFANAFAGVLTSAINRYPVPGAAPVTTPVVLPAPVSTNTPAK